MKAANGNAVQIGDFLNPVVWLNALRQQASRALKQPMDTLILAASWKDDLRECPASVGVQGLMIQGAHYDGSYLSEVGANDHSFSTVPAFKMGWIPESSFSAANKHGLPIYLNASRSQRIATIHVSCSDPTLWILSGAAFVISTE
jgi:dynein heavy chain 2